MIAVGSAGALKLACFHASIFAKIRLTYHEAKEMDVAIITVEPSPHESSAILMADPRVPFLDLLAEVDRERLLRETGRVHYCAGATILSESEPPGSVFFMLLGRATVINFGERGQAVSHRDLVSGDVFGEISALDNKPRSACVEAKTDVEVARMSAASFSELASGEPTFARALALHFASQIRALSMRVLELSTLVVRARLARELARRAVWSGDAWVVGPAPRHADLAARIGTHREAVTKGIGCLVKCGLLTRDDRGFVIRDIEELERINDAI